ncbi:MAG: HEAT repeat domain-containing protein [bacterium]|nr:HEAT repeat domain-containing protein [bacterium]
MGFDLENFGIGFVAGLGTAYVAYQLREPFKDAVEGVRRGAKQAQTSATRSADSRFVNDLIDLCETDHLAAANVRLSDIVVEPRFIPAPEFAGPGETDEGDVMRLVPQFHDHPHLHGAYNVDTLSINELGAGDRAVAILGAPGSGRTTALMAITLQSLGKLTFKPAFDKVQQRIDNEESALNEKQRAVRIKERVTMEKRAQERLATEKGMVWNAETADELKNALPLFSRLMPIYVHMANLNLSNQAEFGAEIDPAEPIVRSVQYTVGRVTASTIPRYLYDRLNAGQTLLLIDGYDDLPEGERPLALAWLKALMEQYKDNFFIVTGPAVGYGQLIGVGLTPVFLRPWADVDAHWSAHRLAESWGQFGRKKRSKTAAALPDEAKTAARANVRAFNPFELTLKTWANYAQDTERPGFEGWIMAYLARQLSAHADQPLAELLPNLTRIAALQIESGYITIQKLQALRISGEAFGIQDTQSVTTEATPPVEAADGASASDKKAKKDGEKEEDSEQTSAQGRLLGLLRRSGLLVRYRGDRYLFKHPLIAAYLASLSLRELSRDVLRARANAPAWRDAFTYAAAHTNLDVVVRDRLTSPPDLLYNQVMDVARWMAFAPPDAAWRGAILKMLTDMIAAPAQYPLLRARAAAALISTRDFKNAAYTFRRAVRNPIPEIRFIAALGMGATGEADTVKDLIPLLDDQDMKVRIAGGMALGAVGTNEALEAMVLAFTSSSEPVRQAIAEQFALLPDEGHPVLYDAMSEEDMAIRRAAVFGLRKVRTVWGLIAIYRAFLEDEQWYVRSAAQNAFEELQFGRAQVPTRLYPQPDQIGWLQEWAAEKGEKLPPGRGAQDMLLRALVEAEHPVKVLAARNIGQLGHVLMIKPLYNALRDRQEAVRAAAHYALADMQVALGKPLPSPT